MRIVTIKRGEIQNISLFSTKDEIKEIRDSLSELLDETKDHISSSKEGYDLIITKGTEDRVVITIECKSSN